MKKKILIGLALLLISKVAYETTFYDYKICRSGIYTKYPKDTLDGNATYYKLGIKVAECGFFKPCTKEFDYLREVCK